MHKIRVDSCGNGLTHCGNGSLRNKNIVSGIYTIHSIYCPIMINNMLIRMLRAFVY